MKHFIKTVMVMLGWALLCVSASLFGLGAALAGMHGAGSAVSFSLFTLIFAVAFFKSAILMQYLIDIEDKT